jgi:hypothetical protein
MTVMKMEAGNSANGQRTRMKGQEITGNSRKYHGTESIEVRKYVQGTERGGGIRNYDKTKDQERETRQQYKTY